MSAGGRAAHVALSLVLLASVAALAWQGPFAFYSPDIAYHMSRIQRSSLNEVFTDPFSGTHTVLPGLFHFAWSRLHLWLGMDAFAIARAASALNVVGTFAAFYVLAVQALGERERAAFAALALGLVLLAPTGRNFLLANPVNLSVWILLAGFGLLWRFVRTDATREWVAGLFLLSLAVALSWYQALAAIGAAALLPRLWREGRLGPKRVAWAVLAIAIPSLWTVAHLWTIRALLPVYGAHSRVLVPWTADASVLRDGLVTYATHWNLKFLPQMWPDRGDTLVFLGLVTPATALLLLWPVGLLLRRRTRPAALEAGARALAAAAALILLGSLVMAMTRDLGRVAPIQFVSFAFVLLYAFRTAPAVLGVRAAQAAAAAAALGGAVCLGNVVWHSGERFEGLTSSTRATVEFLASLPDHAHTRVFVAEAHLRRLTPFVPFFSFVNHRSGLYASQDPVSAGEMFAAYQSILAHDANAAASRARYGVELLAFRHRDSPAQQALAEAYLADGGSVAFRNREWTVVRVPLREAGPSR